MSDVNLLWSDTEGDLRKKNKKVLQDDSVDEKSLLLNIRILTSGKGRTIVEISSLPNNRKWCQELQKSIKKSLSVGGTYKKEVIEIHSSNLKQITDIFDKKMLKWKKIGG